MAGRGGELGQARVSRPPATETIAASASGLGGSPESSNRSWWNPKIRLLNMWSAWWASLHREAAVEQGPEDRVDVGQGGRAGRATLLEDARRPWVAEHDRGGRP